MWYTTVVTSPDRLTGETWRTLVMATIYAFEQNAAWE